MTDEKFETEPLPKDDTRFMPQNGVSDVNNPSEVQIADLSAHTSIQQTGQDKGEETSNGNIKAIKYCRHCGRKVDYESSTYCKYCGKEL